MRENGKGLILCFILALPAWYFGKQVPVVGAPVFGIFIGACLHTFYQGQSAFHSGVKFVSKKILQLAVVFLGFGLNISQILKVGLSSLPIIICTITVALLIAYALQKLWKLDSKIATLIGVGSSICGGSAIAATAPVIEANEEEVAQAISVIFLFNVLAALTFPWLGRSLGLSNEAFGFFAGTAVNDTSSVTAAASAWDSFYPGANSLAVATVVKLTRTLAIIPITLSLSFYNMKQKKEKESVSFRKIFPMFILFFLLASLVTSLASYYGFPNTIFHFCKTLSKFLIVMAMTAIGLNTNLLKMMKSGIKAIALGGLCCIGIGIVSISLQYLLGIW